jgi:hypothetical protein
VLDVVDVGEPKLEQLEEALFGRRQRLGRQQLDEVAKVIATVSAGGGQSFRLSVRASKEDGRGALTSGTRST